VHDHNVRGDAHSDSGNSKLTTTTPRTKPGEERTVRDPKHDRSPVTTDRQAKMEGKPEREKRNFFLFWRHPKRDYDANLKLKTHPPKRCKNGESCTTVSDLSAKTQPPKRCRVGEVCPPCPEGGYRDGKGDCIVSNPPVSNACRADEDWNPMMKTCVTRSRSCPAGESWDGFTCRSAYRDPCEALADQLARQERALRSAGDVQRSACASDPSGQMCTDSQLNYRQETDRYVMAKEQLDQCRAPNANRPSIGSSQIPKKP